VRDTPSSGSYSLGRRVVERLTNWRNLLAWAAIASGLVILVLAVVEGDWLLVGLAVVACAVFFGYGLLQKRDRS
jgi:hypothetical protein